MQNLEEIVKLQQRYEFLKKHPEIKVYPCQESNTDSIDLKFYCYRVKRTWQKIKHIIRIIVAVLLFGFLVLCEIVWIEMGMRWG